jgi:glycosyltransferase involved in cell wall biosynthesis
MNNGASKENEIALATGADILLCTSKQLATRYCKEYLGIDVVGEYWPNTADLQRWDPTRFNPVSNPKPVLGYAGNMNEITIDISLVEKITDALPQYDFVFAGRLNFKHTVDIERFNSILKKKNVQHIGMISYEKIAEVVYSWDVCLMLDRIYELSSFVHHNKIYQYLALGKPVVATKTHDDYSSLSGLVLESTEADQFIRDIQRSIQALQDSSLTQKRIEAAKSNSSAVRAVQFNEIVQSRLTA